MAFITYDNISLLAEKKEISMYLIADKQTKYYEIIFYA